MNLSRNRQKKRAVLPESCWEGVGIARFDPVVSGFVEEDWRRLVASVDSCSESAIGRWRSSPVWIWKRSRRRYAEIRWSATRLLVGSSGQVKLRRWTRRDDDGGEELRFGGWDNDGRRRCDFGTEKEAELIMFESVVQRWIQGCSVVVWMVDEGRRMVVSGVEKTLL